MKHENKSKEVSDASAEKQVRKMKTKNFYKMYLKVSRHETCI